MHSQQGSGVDEIVFFDRLKKVLEQRDTYDSFLKLLDMFAREIIDAKLLIQRAETFFGDTELFAQFKDLMGWDDKRDGGGPEDGPPGSIRTNWTGDWASRNGSDKEERCGKSYRRLPLQVTTSTRSNGSTF